MTASIIILSREDARSRTFPRASRLRAHGKAHSEHKERSRFGLAICAGDTGTILDEFLHSTGHVKRFLVDHVVPHSSDECLIWPFARTRDGYGQVVSKGKHYRVNRLICEAAHGKPDIGQQAAHSCGNSQCVNYRHLRWATAHENAADKRDHGTHLHKLTEKEVRQIRSLQGSLSHLEIAGRFGISKTTVHEILARKKWRWVE